jgi:hypothetical protein
VDLTVVMRGKTFIDQFLIKHEFVKRLRARFHAEGIEPPFPIQTLQTNGPIPVQIQPADAVASPPLPITAAEGDKG